MKLSILEKDLEDYIYNLSQTHEGRLKLKKNGLIISNPLSRQLRLENGGIADLVDFHFANETKEEIIVDVIELKKDYINLDTLVQASKYVRCLTQSLEEYLKSFNLIPCVTLIGESIKAEYSFASVAYLVRGLRLVTYEVKSQTEIEFIEKVFVKDPKAKTNEQIHQALEKSFSEDADGLEKIEVDYDLTESDRLPF